MWNYEYMKEKLFCQAAIKNRASLHCVKLPKFHVGRFQELSEQLVNHNLTSGLQGLEKTRQL